MEVIHRKQLKWPDVQLPVEHELLCRRYIINMSGCGRTLADTRSLLMRELR